MPEAFEKEQTPANLEVQELRDRMEELTEADPSLPKITPEMKAELRTLIGEDVITRKPGLDPETGLRAFYSNDRPAFMLNGTSFEVYKGDPIWENAWKALSEGVGTLKKFDLL